MANHAHSTRTPLLPQAGAQSALLPRGAGRQPGPVTRAIAIMRAASPHPVPEPVPMEELRALLAYDELPPGCIAHPVTEDDLSPHLRPGEFAIVDPADREPVRGELFLVAWDSRTLNPDGSERLALVQAFQRNHECNGKPFTAWWVGSMRNRLSPEATTRLVAEGRWDRLGWSNGPYCDGILERQIRGRVVGVLVSAFEEPKRIGAGAGL